MKMEQTMRQIREMMSVVEDLISTSPREVQAHYAKMEPLWTRLRIVSVTSKASASSV
jgi:hypothetical protein